MVNETYVAVAVVGLIFAALLYVVRAQVLARMSADMAGLSAQTAGHQAAAASDLAHLTTGLARTSDLGALQDRLTQLAGEMTRMATGMAHSSDLLIIQERATQLTQEIVRVDQRSAQLTQESLLFKQGLDASVANLKRVLSEERDAFEQRIKALLENEVGSRAAQHIELHAVPRNEFDRLRTRVDRLVGAEELAERVELARTIFESGDLRVMTWQCKVIRMLDGGLAPDAEEDTMAAAGVPLTAARSFLKKLQELEIVASKKVTSFWLAEDYQWLLVAAEDPTAIRSKIDAFTRNEAEYQAHVITHLAELEPGLIFVGEQWKVPTGRIDIKARDAAGTDVFIELKYPLACSAAYSQLLKYRQDVISQPGAPPARFLLVAPKIPGRVQELLLREQFEARELAY